MKVPTEIKEPELSRMLSLKVFKVPEICKNCKHLYLGLTIEEGEFKVYPNKSEVKCWEIAYMKDNAGLSVGCNFDPEDVNDDFDLIDMGHQSTDKETWGKWIPKEPPTCDCKEVGNPTTFCPRWILKKALLEMEKWQEEDAIARQQAQEDAQEMADKEIDDLDDDDIVI